MGHLRPLLSFIFGLLKQTLQFLQQYIVKNIHPVCGVGNWIHDLLDVSLLPKPLGQGSHPPPSQQSWLFSHPNTYFVSVSFGERRSSAQSNKSILVFCSGKLKFKVEVFLGGGGGAGFKVLRKEQCDLIWQFFNFLVTNFLTKVSQIFR